ncbi:MAG: MGH1-like glycoside hydrolase domain-containing protein [Inquilinus sp.]|uniref:MGH1-like glycoside hydrolase domain-containing protein n=1 Tax=Inquilinus sp. TaxID=1932117 RepID=UPI003F386118
MTTELTEAAIAVLRANDRGDHTVPTPASPRAAQRNWDSSLATFGLAQFDEDRAWTEIETLLAGQEPDGMVPHLLLHGDESDDVASDAAVPGLTHPPVAATAARHLFERFGVRRSRPRLRILAPKLLAWHRWFVAARDPESTGLAAIIDPEESGMAGSPAWNAAAAPFRVADIGFNAILHRANRDLRFLLDMIDDRAGMVEVDRMIAGTRAALEACWDKADGVYHSRDAGSGQAIRQPGIGGLLPLYADPALAARHPALPARLETWLDQAPIAVPSVEPGQPEFDPGRPWRGPVSLPVNWMLYDGIRRAGRRDLAARIRRDSMAVAARSGFREYFDPITGEGIGGADVSSTAAMVLLFAGLED